MDTDFKKTLFIFQTEMPIRVDMKEFDQRMFHFYKNKNIDCRFFEFCNSQKVKFTLHDGPPYANGPIHLGHAYNKIMKDIVIRSHAMMGYNTYTTPGWDCHGLPIEHKILQNNFNLDRVEMKKHCRKYASEWIENQKESFKKLAVLMDFNNPYLTMNYNYQSDIIRSFGKLNDAGYIYRSKKTIPWCCKCQTTLATAEIEYKNKKDPSIYVLFKLKNFIFSDIGENIVYLVIWTTTPWTLPLNRGVMLKKNTEYLLLLSENKYIIIGKDCYVDFCKKTKKEYVIIKKFISNELMNNFVEHPFEENFFVPIIFEDVVEVGEGTACVHTAPGCGPIDYEIGIKNNLEIYSPISNDGKYTSECVINELVGKSIEDALGWVIKKLDSKGILWCKGSINHSYPHCWRSKDPLIFRATPQWFCNLEKNNFKYRVARAIESISFYPLSSRSFLESTVSNRWEWCISRQRSWGVPIVALLNKNGSYWTSTDFIMFVADQVAIHGVEYWDSLSLISVKHLLPPNFKLNEWRKETNILDVWFDSGVSHFSVLQKHDRFPADVYLEGVDQHRGWFQSSLLTSIALYDKAPMKSIISCGHTVDEKGQKMSKSLGNVISPEEIINKIGLDGLRLWVSSLNLGGDVVFGKRVFENISEVYRKIRNSCRFAVQNIIDFDPANDSVSFEEMAPIERLIVEKILLYQVKIIIAYQEYNYPEIFHIFIEVFNTLLSAFYFDSVKDVLYCYPQKSHQRRSVQTVIYIILESLTRLMTPIIPYTAEDITNYYKSEKSESIQISLFYSFPQLKNSLLWQIVFKNGTVNTFYDLKNIAVDLQFIDLKKQVENSFFIVTLLREKVFLVTEKLRQDKIIKQSMESEVVIYILESSSIFGYINNIIHSSGPEYLAQILQVSSVSLFLLKDQDLHNNYIYSSNIDIAKIQNEMFEKYGFMIAAKKHHGVQCERCWKYFSKSEYDNLCNLCGKIVCK